MRFFFILHAIGIIFFVNNLLAETNHARLTSYMKIFSDCTKENNITLEVYTNATKTNRTDEDTYEKVKCVDACMFKKHYIMKPDGTIDMKKVVEHLSSDRAKIPKDEMKKNIEMCNVTKQENECDTAHDLMNCALGHY